MKKLNQGRDKKVTAVLLYSNSHHFTNEKYYNLSYP